MAESLTFPTGRRLQSLRLRIAAWFKRNGRDLPWRRTTDPYRVFVSEIMLQQTTVTTVTPRFERFLERFPNVASLAAAEEVEVLKSWEGLGYYRRARSLWSAARVLMERREGRFPADPEELLQLPGVGRYTANAVICFATGARLPILEANTKRLWSRFLGQTDRPDLPAASKVLWEAAERCLPKVGAREFNWALMDLGAAVCKPKTPDCKGCPLRSDCRAAASDDPERFPAPPTKSRKNRRREVALVLRRQDQLLLRKRTEPGRYRHFWELPVCDARSGEDLRRTADRLLSEVSPVGIDFARQPIRLRYGIVNEIVELSGFIAESDLGVGADRSMSANYRWVSDLELAALPLSSPQRRLLKLAGWLRTE